MSRIKLMSMDLANKIAAGEVVERPSSVIKELVENSIDANSTEITVEINDGGRTLIKVTDNGIGMDKEDAILSFSRHASSKIKNVHDLDSLKTLGFRGEAIPSIASVSNFTMVTSDGTVGTKIIKTLNKEIEVSDCPLRKGTEITIEKLFYNIPARLKFLKTDKFEKMKSIEIVQNIALSFPSIQFKMIADKRLVFQTTGRGDLLETIFTIHGSYIAKNLFEIEYKENGLEISGFISKPEINYSNKFNMHTYINNRSIYNYKLNKAIENAYSDYLPPNRYPFTCINLKIDPFLVDVNIHPSKREVKISNEEHIITFFKNVILSKLQELKPVYSSSNINHKDNSDKYEKLNLLNSLEQSSFSNNKVGFDENESNLNENKEELLNSYLEELFSNDESLNNSNHETTNSQRLDSVSINSLKQLSNTNETLIFSDKINDESSDNILFSNLIPLGQILNTYIVFSSYKGLVLMDQHAAAERINFEKYSEYFSTPHSQVIPLLPITIDIAPSLLVNFDDNHKQILNQAGFDVEEFGQNTLKINKIPSFLQNKDEYIKDIVISCLEDKQINIANFTRNSIATIACKASIKANKELSVREINVLLDSLRKCKNPANCPHGRPTLILLSKYELEKLFKRTGF